MINYYAVLSDYRREVNDREGLDSGTLEDQDEMEDVESPLLYKIQPSQMGTDPNIRETSAYAAKESDNTSQNKLIKFKNPTTIVYNK